MADIKLKLKTPTVPNYITIELPSTGHRQDIIQDSPKLAVGDLTDEQLDSLAHDWKIALFANANRQRKEKKS